METPNPINPQQEPDRITPPVSDMPDHAASSMTKENAGDLPPVEDLDFDYQPSDISDIIIKVVGVGGGGGNAVSHMYREGIKDVSFLVINTDRQALRSSPIPDKLQIGPGLGAGAKPEIARQYALESVDEIRAALADGTQMVFVTAGMGGGTGTGAAPIVAQIAREMNILTIGIVTIPFGFEGRRKIKMALEGVEKIRDWVDALLIVNNDRLCKIYPDLEFSNAFSKADDTLTIAARSISEIITSESYINVDFADVKTTLQNSGVAIISTGYGEGQERVTMAINDAVNSPLLMGNEIHGAQHILFDICFSHEDPITMQEIAELNNFMDQFQDEDIEVIWGATFDDTLGKKVKMIILASGFNMESGGNTTRTAPTKPTQPTPETPTFVQKPSTASPGQQESVPAPARTPLQEEPARPVQETPKPATSAAPASTHPVPENTAPDPSRPVRPAFSPQNTEAPVTAGPARPAASAAAPAAPTPRPSVAQPAKPDDNDEGLKHIEDYYGNELADKIRNKSARAAYYILDDSELDNETLVTKLEQIPAYNRHRSDLASLHADPQEDTGSIAGPNGTIRFQ